MKEAYMGLYADGAMIKTEYSTETEEVSLIIARDNDTPDQEYILSHKQANEIIYAMSRALLIQGIEGEESK